MLTLSGCARKSGADYSRMSRRRRDAYAKGPPLPPLGEGEPRTLVAALRRAATTLPMRGITFVSADDSLGRLLSYAQLLEGAALRLGAFQAMGIRQGEPLLMQVAELDDHILALWGCLLGGIAPVNISLPPKYDASQHSKSAPSGLHSCDTSFEGSGLLFIAGRSPLGRYGSLVYLFHCMPPSITFRHPMGSFLSCSASSTIWARDISSHRRRVCCCYASCWTTRGGHT